MSDDLADVMSNIHADDVADKLLQDFSLREALKEAAEGQFDADPEKLGALIIECAEDERMKLAQAVINSRGDER